MNRMIVAPINSNTVDGNNNDSFLAMDMGKSISTCSHRRREYSNTERVSDDHNTHFAGVLGRNSITLDGGSIMKTLTFDIRGAL